MKPELEKVSPDIDPKELADILSQDGAAIVENALNPQQLTNLNTDVDGVIAATAPRLRHATNNFDEVKKMPLRCQELLGYKAHEGIGVVDVGSPVALLQSIK